MNLYINPQEDKNENFSDNLHRLADNVPVLLGFGPRGKAVQRKIGNI